MQAMSIKGSLIGKTFALAKINDSAGRKSSRNRHSKEERKAMVQSFIKRYQKLNNGDFPSLNLTQKEVGGSFYTVREIVREVIQENRVLRPGTLSPDLITDQFTEQSPFGSIAMEPQTPLSLLPDETNGAPKCHEVTSEGVVIISEGDHQQKDANNGCINSDILVDVGHREFTELERAEVHVSTPTKADEYSGELVASKVVHKHQSIENTKEINGAHVGAGSGEYDGLTISELQASEPSKSDKDIGKLVDISSDFTPIIEDVVVETFPIRPVTKPVDRLDQCTETLGEEIPKIELGESNVSYSVNGSTSMGISGLVLEDEKAAENVVVLPVEKGSGLLERKAENIRHGTSHHTNDTDVDTRGFDCNVVQETSKQSQASASMEAISSPENLKGAYANIDGGSTITKVEKEGRTNVGETRCSGNSQRDINPNRNSLHPQQGATENPTETETNPVWAVVKAFIDAFVKFWSQ